MTGPVSRERARAVLRRAAELEDQSASSRLDSNDYDRAALVQAAAEAGIGAEAMGRALAELDAGLLEEATDLPTTRRGFLGAAGASVVEEVPIRADAARQRIRRWLRAQVLEPIDRKDGIEVWSPRRDTVARLRRKVDLNDRLRLSGVGHIEMAVVPVGDEASLVRLTADLSTLRNGLRSGVVLVPTVATPLGGAALTVVTGEMLFLFGTLPMAAALAGAAVFGARRTLANEREQARRAITLFLDDLARPR